jgi:hypothetical protein
MKYSASLAGPSPSRTPMYLPRGTSGIRERRSVKTSNAIAAWNKADPIFLMDALKRGVAEAYVASFLGRSEDEVREQANALKRRRLPNKNDRPAMRNSR